MGDERTCPMPRLKALLLVGGLLHLIGSVALACSCGRVGERRTVQEQIERTIELGAPLLLAEVAYSEPFIETLTYPGDNLSVRTRERRMVRLLLVVHEAWNWKKTVRWAVTKSGGSPACGVNYWTGGLFFLQGGVRSDGSLSLHTCAQSLTRPGRIDRSRLPEPGYRRTWDAAGRRDLEDELSEVLAGLRPGCSGSAGTLEAAFHARSRKDDGTIAWADFAPTGKETDYGLWFSVFYRGEERRPLMYTGSGAADRRCWLVYEANHETGEGFSAWVPPFEGAHFPAIRRSSEAEFPKGDYRVEVLRHPLGKFLWKSP